MKKFQGGSMDRRSFLVGSAAAAATVVMPESAGSAPADVEWRNKQAGMTYRRLGRTGFMVSSVGMGGDDISPDNYDHVLYAMDLGLNYFDTSPQYGRGKSEEGYALVLKARGRESAFLTTKTLHPTTRDWKPYDDLFESLPASEQARYRELAREEVERTSATKPEYMGHYFRGQDQMIRKVVLNDLLVRDFSEKVEGKRNCKADIIKDVEGSLKRLGTDYLDCLLCPHGADVPSEAVGTPGIFEAFEILKKQGKVRHLGFSAHSDPARILDAAVENGLFSMGQVAYNFINHSFVDDAIDRAVKADLGVLVMKASRILQNPFQRSRLVPDRVQKLNEIMPGDDLTPFQKGLKWVLKNPKVNGVVMGISNMEMAKQDVPLALERA
jgi:aryl-alcohol dehydrogenase-like predicted oxidoreductase